MTSELVHLAHELRDLDRDELYAVWQGAIRQAERERKGGFPERARVWQSFADVTGARYEEVARAA